MIQFDNTYLRDLPGTYLRQAPDLAPAPALVVLNNALAAELGLEIDDPAGWFSGAVVPEGAEPAALAYAGHQFGGFSPSLGDGRAHLLGEFLGPDGRRWDLQLKGSGRTPFSRGGDGKAALAPMLREYLISEAMAALRIPTTRSLAVVATGETVLRESGPLPGAVLARVAASHIRVGTFQFFAAREDIAGVKQLADHVIARHYPDAAEAEHPIRALLDAVIRRQAELVARWLHVGFIHGVMNTDNCSVSGETIDYGPCAFMDAYDPATVYSSIDEMGRYAYANQPRIALWNLTRFAETLLPLIDSDEKTAIEIAQAALGEFSDIFDTAYQAGLRRKLGLFTSQPDDAALAQDLLTAMTANQADFTLTFRRLGAAAVDADSDEAVRGLFIDPTAFDAWAVNWRARLGRESQDAGTRHQAMQTINPAFIPRNHRVEAVIQAALADDYAPFEKLLAVLAKPYEDQPEMADYAEPPEPDQRVLKTFCGT